MNISKPYNGSELKTRIRYMKSTFTAMSMEFPGISIDCEVGTAVVFTRKSPAKPADNDNEDSSAVYQIDSQACALIVADGMGGAALAQTASKIVVNTLCEKLKKCDPANNKCRDEILNGIEEANKKIYQLGVGAGSTVAIAEVFNNVIRPYHAGDSKILVVGGRGKLKMETISHSPTEYAVESGYLEPTEALDHEARHYVTNMLGSKDMRIEIGSPLKLAKKDTILIASDGLFDNLHLHEIISILYKGKLQEVMQKLVQMSYDRMLNQVENEPSKQDDLTIILYRSN